MLSVIAEHEFKGNVWPMPSLFYIIMCRAGDSRREGV
jgi:hypothetical protein